MAEPPKDKVKKKRGLPKGSKFAGRRKGSRNKSTIARETAARLERKRIEEIERQFDEGKEPAEVAASVAGIKPAVQVLQDFMAIFAARAIFVQPWPPHRGTNPNENVVEFYRNAEAAVSIAKDLAPYQAPKLSAVMVGAATVEEILISGGLPDDQDGGLLDAPTGNGTEYVAGPTIDLARNDGSSGEAAGHGAAADVSPGTGEVIPLKGQA